MHLSCQVTACTNWFKTLEMKEQLKGLTFVLHRFFDLTLLYQQCVFELVYVTIPKTTKNSVGSTSMVPS